MNGELWLLLRTALSLGVVLALAVVLLRFGLPRLSGRRLAGHRERLAVLEVRSLDRQHRMALVEAEGRRFLVAYGPGGMAKIEGWPAGAELSEKEPSGPVAVEPHAVDDRAAS